jgi:trehalose 6-phosphate phosphatase
MPKKIVDDFALSRDCALFLDFDGTLTALQSDPAVVFLDNDQEKTLSRCAQKLNDAVAIISGRDLSDLCKRVPNRYWRYGNHGLFGVGPGQAPIINLPQPPNKLLHHVRQETNSLNGVWFEIKGPVIAVHYRNAPHYGRDLISMMRQAIDDFPEYKAKRGRKVVEAMPVDADKGEALAFMMSKSAFVGRKPVMIGDDKTDEDAFVRAQSLGGAGIKVGKGKTNARYRLSNVAAVYELMRELK